MSELYILAIRLYGTNEIISVKGGDGKGMFECARLQRDYEPRLGDGYYSEILRTDNVDLLRHLAKIAMKTAAI